MNNLKDIIDDFKIRKIVKEEKKCNPIVIALIVVGAIAVIAAVAYAIYRFFAPDYLADFEDDEFEDEFNDDFFEEDDLFEDDEVIIIHEENEGGIFEE